MNAFAPTPFFDNLVSLMSGLGVAGRDKNFGLSHVITLLSRTDLEAAYRSDWIARKIVDRPAKDATREWRSWQTESDAIELLEAVEKQHNIQRKLYQGLRLARLYGGAALIMGVKQGTTEDELVVDDVKQGDLEFVHPVSMYSIAAGPMVSDITSPWYGEPSYYTTFEQSVPVMANKAGVQLPAGVTIHPSRVVILRGAEFPDPQAATLGLTNPVWGDSILQTVMDAVKAATLVAQSTATMVNEAKIDIVKIPGMSQHMGSEEYRNLLTTRFTYANVSKSLINTLMLDTAEEWERINANFAQLPDLLRVFLLIVSGAADIPATVMLGQSPAGMSATGESDTRNYYDRIHSDQETELTPTLAKLDEVLIRSALGQRDPSLFYIWNPLWQMDDLQSAQVNKYKADIFAIDNAAGLIDAEALRVGRQNQLIEDGVYPGLEEALEKQQMLGEESMLSPEAQQTEALKAQTEQLKVQAQFAPKPAAPGQPGQKPKLSVVKDSIPKPLYVYREVLNYKDIVRWAKDAGFKTTLGDDMHVTICYSRTPVDWMKAGSDDWTSEKDGSLRVGPGGPRVLDKFGEAIVLQFASSTLSWRHEGIKRSAGASFDFDEYQPHITITYDPPPDWQRFEPYRGEIILGPEIFEDINDDYRSSVVEDRQSPGPTRPRGQPGAGLADFNPYHEPAGKPTGGQFTSGGGSEGFVSPNTANLTFEEAQKELGSKRQRAIAEAAKEIDIRMGIESDITPVIGAWSDGAENSLMVVNEPGGNEAQERAALAMKGWVADQKAVLYFRPQDGGTEAMAKFTMSGKLDAVHDELLKRGIGFHTLEQAGDDVTVHVYASDQDTLDLVGKAAKDHGTALTVAFGKGEFIGTQKSDGSDREQRDDARRVYEDTIAAAKGGKAGQVWPVIRNRWDAKRGAGWRERYGVEERQVAAEAPPTTGKAVYQATNEFVGSTFGDADTKAYLLEKGRKDGNEHSLIFDRGKVISDGTSGLPNRVKWSPEAVAASDDPEARLEMHHNHPENRSFSTTDLAGLSLAGVEETTVYGHGGDTYHAEAAGELKQAKEYLRQHFTTKAAFDLNTAWVVTLNATESVVSRAFDADIKKSKQFITRIDEANSIHAHTVNTALAQAGLIDYETTRGLDLDRWPELPKIINRAAAMATKKWSEQRAGNLRPTTDVRGHEDDLAAVAGVSKAANDAARRRPGTRGRLGAGGDGAGSLLDFSPEQPRDPKGSPTGGRWTKAGAAEGGDIYQEIFPDKDDLAEFRELKDRWAKVNNDMLQYVDDPECAEAKAGMSELKDIVKAMYKLDCDTGSLADIGKPGGPRDVIIVGGGPGGLAAATMGGVDGLDTLLVEADKTPGGQAKYSSRIENYPGFPVGVPGEKLTSAMAEQAERTGTDMRLGVRVTAMSYDDKTGMKTVTLSNGETYDTRAVVIAGGLQFRTMDFPGSKGAGVIYGDGKELAAEVGDGEAVVIGGSNGAAQAALGAARTAKHVTLIARSPIAGSMSDYQVGALHNHPKVTVIEGDAIASFEHDADTGKGTQVITQKGVTIPATALGLFIGSVPETTWVPPQIERDKTGRIITNATLETNMPGVYAIGDVRVGGMGRIGAAVGEGQIAMRETFMHFDAMAKAAGIPAKPVHDALPVTREVTNRNWDRIVDDIWKVDDDHPWFGQTIERLPDRYLGTRIHHRHA